MIYRSIVAVATLVMVATACNDGSGSAPNAGETASIAASNQPAAVPGGLDPVGGATFRGTFEAGPGVGPGEISFVLDNTGKRIVSAIIDPALHEFACPTGVIISGGGISGTYTPGIAIEGGSFDKGDWSGVFVSATEAHGSYSLQESFDCPYRVAWTATSE